VQLQLTRDKNGVYVEPGEYYAMEARLAAQENQIAECEAALKSKTDEIKALRSENTLLASDLDSVKSELQHVQEKLLQITLRFEETKSELHQTQTELAASDAVVREQVDTENSLYDCGETLLSEAQSRRSDVDNLLGKMDRFVSVEQSRLKQTQTTITSLRSIKAVIDENTASFKQDNSEQSTFLQNGIADMLQRSHFTCDTLKAAIDEALQSLLADTGRARDSMTESCDNLSEQLMNMNKHVTTILVQVQSGLSAWLSDVDASMSATQQQLTQQQTTVSFSLLTDFISFPLQL
jgi:chromosome segregation ATPase